MTEEYWPYTVARKHLIERLQASDDEIGMWALIGSQDGGIDAFDKPYKHQGYPPPLHFSASTVTAYFLRSHIASFAPDDSRRYLSLPTLCERWDAYGLPEPETAQLIRDLIEHGDLETIDLPRISSDGGVSDVTLIPLDQIKAVEIEYFPERQERCADAAVNDRCSEPASPTAVAGHNMKARRRELDAEIEQAKEKASSPSDHNSLFAALSAIAQTGVAPFTGIVNSRGIEYRRNATGKLAYFSSDALRKRMNPGAR